jgi:polysaccharide biosynthesis/export protein ExoF
MRRPRAVVLVLIALGIMIPAGFEIEKSWTGQSAARDLASRGPVSDQGSKTPLADRVEVRDAPPPIDAANNDAGNNDKDAGNNIGTGPASGPGFRNGDKLKVAFYERVEFQEDKWTKTRAMQPSLQQRAELSGEFTVQDGAITLPLLGTVVASGRAARDVQSDLQNAFKKAIGRDGLATIVLLERQPIYVLGPVKSPGAYKFAPGLTVLHAVALAGGLDRATLESWQQLEGIRETERGRTSVDHLTQLLARIAVLEAERDGIPVKTPMRLLEIAGETKAKSALSLEIERRNVTVSSNSARESALSTAVENAKNEIETLSGRIVPIEQNLKLRQERVDRLHGLASRNVVDNLIVQQAASELLTVQESRQQALESITLAKQRRGMAEQEKTRYHAEMKGQLEQDIDRAEQERVDLERDLAASKGVLAAIARTSGPTSSVTDDMISYEVVRNTSEGTRVLNCTGTTALEPGDLVRLRAGHPGEQHMTSVLSGGDELGTQ